MHATGSEDRTPRRTHIFLSVAHFDHHTHMRVAQDLTGHMFGTRCTSAHLESHPLTTCFIDHSLTCLTHCHQSYSTPPLSTPTALPMTGIRRHSYATPHGGYCFGLLAGSTPLATSSSPSICTQSRHDEHDCSSSNQRATGGRARCGMRPVRLRPFERCNAGEEASQVGHQLLRSRCSDQQAAHELEIAEEPTPPTLQHHGNDRPVGPSCGKEPDHAVWYAVVRTCSLIALELGGHVDEPDVWQTQRGWYDEVFDPITGQKLDP